MLLLLFVAWIVFNGKITWEILWLGAVVSVLLYAFMCKFMDYDLNKEKRIYRKAMFMGRYVALLAKEIVSANLAVIRLILSREEEIEPCMRKFSTDLRSENSKVILANSITLTPGTITVSLNENEFVVHCLDNRLAEGIEDTVFQKQLKEMEAALDEQDSEKKGDREDHGTDAAV
ncbi:MAG: Na+/H+ antiporter subunit E [Lachnospiraceae bacterium]|nr:Na+/H+ antiporter subunit E [Lachnospiraceae bacterium]